MFTALFQVTHWHSPYFNAYFPTAHSFPAMLADMLSGAIGCIGFSWVCFSFCSSIHQVSSLSVCIHPASQSVFLSICLSIHQFRNLNLPVHPSVHPSIHPSIYSIYSFVVCPNAAGQCICQSWLISIMGLLGSLL